MNTVLVDQTEYHADEFRLRTRLASPQHRDDYVEDLSTRHLVELRRVAGMPAATVTGTVTSLRRRGNGDVEPVSQVSRRMSILRTANDLLLMTRDGVPSPSHTFLWDVDGDRLSYGSLELDRVHEHLGRSPAVADRVPLLDRSYRDAVPVADDFGLSEIALLTPMVVAPWIDAGDTAQVVRKLFGPAHYRKPLARLAMTAHPAILAFYAQFRGLVPVDDLVAVLQRPHGPALQLRASRLYDRDLRAVRSLLRQVPTATLRRFLTHDDLGETVGSLVDASRSAGQGRLGPAIERLGQRQLRRPADLEQLVLRLTEPPVPMRTAEHRRQAQWRLWREEVAEAEALRLANTERLADGDETLTWAQWLDPAVREAEGQRRERFLARLAAEQEEAENRRLAQARSEREAVEAERVEQCRVDSMLLAEAGEIAGMSVVVATDPEQLVEWSNRMHNCIRDYRKDVGFDVFAALVKGDPADEDHEVVVNLQISRGRINQILCKRNRNLADRLGQAKAQRVLDELHRIGGWASEGAWGTAGLVSPETLQTQNT